MASTHHSFGSHSSHAVSKGNTGIDSSIRSEPRIIARKPTIQNIAERAGVGAGTVSRVLNDHPHVSETSRTKVKQAITELEYRPSFAARHLRTQQSQVIGFVADEISTTPFAGRTIEGAQRWAWNHDKLLYVVNTGGDPEIEHSVVEQLLVRQVEGVIYAAMYHKKVEPPTLLQEVLTVLLNCYSDDGRYPSVVPDEARAGFEGTQALLAKGHCRVAFINARAETIAATERLRGYRAALSAHGLPFDETLVRPGNWAADGGYEHTLAVMNRADPPTALFCANDRTAMGAYDALRDLGLCVPEDVAVLGFDNQEVIAAYLRPALSTMALPHFEMGRWAVEHLLGPDAANPVQAKLHCPFVARASL